MTTNFNSQALKPLSLNVTSVSSRLTWADRIGALKMRIGVGRNNYRVKPGLYKVGNPDSQSDVLVSANYKLSFDVLRSNLDSLNVWILVVDTKGVNVWCSAAKGNFSTDSVVKSLKETSLEHRVQHRRIILPQLSASGVAAHKVKEQTGFNALFGPVEARDIKPYIEAGYKATPAMRKVTFPMKERAKLIPVDFLYEKYKLLILIGLFFFLSGLDRTGFLFGKMMDSHLFPLITILGGYIAGIVITPLFLPWIPFRAFALKGAFWGLSITLVINRLFKVPILDGVSMGLIGISIASFMAMNFTGSSTYTSLSGVRKEMKWAVPFQIAFIVVGTILFILSKLA
ncbi:MAG: mercury methylation corrinoid protein HgcA [Bacteroidales bacterium]|nr:mercury methylation corrinoid protein HgcA [Bacteroidales bacterium]